MDAEKLRQIKQANEAKAKLDRQLQEVKKLERAGSNRIDASVTIPN